jgi:transposase
MSAKELKRWVVMRRVRDRELSRAEAAAVLGLSYRQIKRLFQRFRTRGQKGLVHGNVGQPSNRAHPIAVRRQAMALITEHFGGPARGRGQRFGPTLAAEHLAEEFGLRIPVPTLRRWMLSEKLWTRLRKSKRSHRRRTRRAHFGELVQMDGSFHAWLEERGDVACLLTMIDDATGRTLGRFTGEETTWGAAEVLQRWIEKYGVPQALYVDAKTVFVRQGTVNELAAGIAPVTQFGRMCAKLGIRLLVAKSPEAKGRVERVHGTNQDRLVKKLRRRGITTYAAANHFLLADYFPAHNARFAVEPLEQADFHLPLPPRINLTHVFCLEVQRVVGNDWVVRYENQLLQLLPTARAKRHIGPRAKILVRETAAGELFLVARTRAGDEHILEWTAVSPTTAAVRAPSVFRTPTVRVPPPPVPPPAGYTRSGKPLSIRQMAMRSHWDGQAKAHVQQLAARRTPPTSDIS